MLLQVAKSTFNANKGKTLVQVFLEGKTEESL